MKWGMVSNLAAREFWKTLNLPGEWIEGSFEELLTASVQGIFVNPDDSEIYLKKSHQMSQGVSESRFLDFLEIKGPKLRPVGHLQLHGSELLTLGQKSLETRLRAYVTGTSPWSRLFAVLAVEKGFADIQIIVDEPGEATEMIQDLRKFCFGVKIEAIRHADLTLQPNNGALLVNTAEPSSSPEVIEDLAYLNYLTPGALVIDTRETLGANPLLEEAKHSKLAFLDGFTTQAFFEFHALTPVLSGITWEDYQRRRQDWRNSPSVQ